MRLFIIGSLLLVGFSIAMSAKIDPVILLKGKVMNGSTPVAKAEIQFKDESGSPSIRSKSASDGSYQAVLKPNKKYKVVITTDDFTTFNFNYDVPAYDKYTELTQDFPVGAVPAPVVASSEPTTKQTKKKSSTKKSKKGK